MPKKRKIFVEVEYYADKDCVSDTDVVSSLYKMLYDKHLRGEIESENYYDVTVTGRK